MNCAAIDRYVDAFVDGEVDASARIEVERHLAGCPDCRQRLEFTGWLKNRLQRETQIKAPDALRSRVERAFEDERSSGAFGRIDASWRTTAAVAAVALLIFGVGRSLHTEGRVLQAGVAPLLEDVVRAHGRSYPSEVAQGDQVQAFEQRVGFPVRPVEFGDPTVRFLGARAVEVGGRHAVTLLYEARGRRMTVVAFRPPARAGQFGERIESGGRSIRYVRVQGHLVPLVEHRGVLYAVVGDLDPEDGLRLAAHASLR
jgi:anti-sigma factor RsiW